MADNRGAKGSKTCRISIGRMSRFVNSLERIVFVLTHTDYAFGLRLQASSSAGLMPLAQRSLLKKDRNSRTGERSFR